MGYQTDTAASIEGVTRGNAANVNGDPKGTWWLWTECGEGILYPVVGFRDYDGWIVCNYRPEAGLGDMTTSFCVCDDTPVFRYADAEARRRHEEALAAGLKANREAWSRQHQVCISG